MLIADKAVVAIHYTLKNSEGELIDTSDGSDPLLYLHGFSNIIPGLETELTGKTTGDALTVVVEPEKGYGEYKPEMVQVVPRQAFEGIEDIQVGMQFQAQSPEGDVQMIAVREVEGENITIDANHPLAGVTLHFDVTIDSVREATEEELEHGHVH